MTGWAMKRFWTEAAPLPEDRGWGIRLDGRPLRTPEKRLFVVPTRALADAVADEWNAQGETVRPGDMPFTRMANSAIDTLGDTQAEGRAKVVAMLADYADADLTCYRAPAPEGLVARQSAAWDPLLDWLDQTHGARLRPRAGVMHAAQDARALARLTEAVAAFPDFELAALHDLVTLSGSLVIGLAAASPGFAREDLWAASRIDESWQAEIWGIDDEAAALSAARRGEFLQATAFLDRACDTGTA